MPAKGKGQKDQFTCGLQNPSSIWKTLALSPVLAHIPFLGFHAHHGCHSL